MDAVKFLVECHNRCEDCRLKAGKEFSMENCFLCSLNHHISNFKQEGAEEMVRIVEQLIKEKKSKTRQSEFLKMFPNAPVNKGTVLGICPRDVDLTFVGSCERRSSEFCNRCKKEYWLEPIEETTNKETNQCDTWAENAVFLKTYH